MKRLAAIAMLLALSGCGRTIDFFFDRAQCGLKCPKNSSCQADGHGGVFFGSSACLCDYPRPGVYNDSPSKGHPCLPKPKEPKR
jgi:hypothetical protein